MDAGLLNVGYAEAGPAGVEPVILRLALRHLQLCRCRPLAGVCGLSRHRAIPAWLRHHAVPNGQPAAIAVDTIALMDALKIEKATLAGFDWGARTANIMAALWPEVARPWSPSAAI
jgi:pimeloyl-ACP methyl ester carboxylesterase